MCRSEFRACCALCVLFVSLVPSAAYFFASLLFFLLYSFLQAHQVETQLGQTSQQESAVHERVQTSLGWKNRELPVIVVRANSDFVHGSRVRVLSVQRGSSVAFSYGA